jgi:hypothetical protein
LHHAIHAQRDNRQIDYKNRVMNSIANDDVYKEGDGEVFCYNQTVDVVDIRFEGMFI